VVASKISTVTGGGKAFRYGGEEFTIIFKGKDLQACIPHLEAVRELIANYKLTIRKKETRPKTSKSGKKVRASTPSRRKTKRGISVTISIGVAEKSEKYSNSSDVLKASDKALYKAKKAGRNCLINV